MFGSSVIMCIRCTKYAVCLHCLRWLSEWGLMWWPSCFGQQENKDKKCGQIRTKTFFPIGLWTSNILALYAIIRLISAENFEPAVWRKNERIEPELSLLLWCLLMYSVSVSSCSWFCPLIQLWWYNGSSMQF